MSLYRPAPFLPSYTRLQVRFIGSGRATPTSADIVLRTGEAGADIKLLDPSLIPTGHVDAEVVGVGQAVTLTYGAGTASGTATVAGIGSVATLTSTGGSVAGNALVSGIGGALLMAGGSGTVQAEVNLQVSGAGAVVELVAGSGAVSGNAAVQGVGQSIIAYAGEGSFELPGTATVDGVGVALTLLAGVGQVGEEAGPEVIVGGGEARVVRRRPSRAPKLIKVAVEISGEGAYLLARAGAGKVSGDATVFGTGATARALAGLGVAFAHRNVELAGMGPAISVRQGSGAIQAQVNASIEGRGLVSVSQSGTGEVHAGLLIVAREPAIVSEPAQPTATILQLPVRKAEAKPQALVDTELEDFVLLCSGF